MFDTSDLINKTNSALLEVDYFNVPDLEKPLIVESALKYYTLSKADAIGTKFENLSLEDLLEKINKKLNPNEKRMLFNKYTHFILSMINGIQNSEVIWEISEEKDLINNPLVNFNNEGLLDELVTHEDTDPYATFLFILDIFKNHLFSFKNINAERSR